MLNSNLKLSKEGFDLIKHYEGFSSKPYLCPGNVWTIGYGHTGGVGAGTGLISKQEAEELLKRDVKAAEEIIRAFVTVELNANQFSALVSFVFNVGKHNFLNSTLVNLLNAGEKTRAAAEFPRWVYAGGRRLKGLEARRLAEQKLFLQEG